MVYGLDKFREYFENYTGQYVFIGGTACSIILDELGSTFRATKDLDTVLLIEAIDESFGATFWRFIEDGGYEHRQKGTENKQFYRFTKPSDSDFPSMIELFCRKPEKIELQFDSGLTPIHLSDNVASLSAILLNDAYYELLTKGKSIVNGYSVLAIEYILLFKIKAWLDLSERKELGIQIDSRDVKKHKNDVFRLLVNIPPSSTIQISDEINEDINGFIERITNERIDLKSLGIRTTNLEELIVRIRGHYIN